MLLPIIYYLLINELLEYYERDKYKNTNYKLR